MHVGLAWQKTALAVRCPQTQASPAVGAQGSSHPTIGWRAGAEPLEQSPAQALNAGGSDGQVRHCKGGCIEAPAAAH